ncbi:hypothetical protein ABLE92_01115 [Gordonia sp. VNQ95]|uniref:hypothetical protein n=1 Tax=Gordonia TaxID=2053 RepID=UPI0032B4294A
MSDPLPYPAPSPKSRALILTWVFGLLTPILFAALTWIFFLSLDAAFNAPDEEAQRYYLPAGCFAAATLVSATTALVCLIAAYRHKPPARTTELGFATTLVVIGCLMALPSLLVLTTV